MAPLDGGSCKFVFFFFSTDQHNTRVRRGCVLRYFWPQVQWGHPSVQSGKKAPNEHPAYVGPPTTLTFQKQQKVLCWVFDLADILPMSCFFLPMGQICEQWWAHSSYFSPKYVDWIIINHVHCACMCLSTHVLHVCKTFVVMVFRACLWSRSTLWRGGGKQVHLLDFFVFPQALEHSPPLCGVQQMPLSYSPQMISPAAVRLELASAAVTI